MYQEIVLSADFIKFIEDKYQEFAFGSECHKVLQQISTETIVIDCEGEWKKRVDKLIQNSPKKEQLMAFFSGWQQYNFFKKVTPDNKLQNSRYKFSQKELIFETNLCLSTQDKILLKNNLNNNEQFILRSEFDVEALDFITYTNPPPDSRVLTAYRIITLKNGDSFDLINFFRPFLKATKTLIIQDGYLFNKNRSLRNLKDLLSIVDKNIQIKIITLTDEARNRSQIKKENGQVVNAEKELTDLKQKYGLKNFCYELKNSKQDLHARFIETDHFFIHLDKGLDFLYTTRDGKKISSESVITIIAKSKNNHG